MKQIGTTLSLSQKQTLILYGIHKTIYTIKNYNMKFFKTLIGLIFVLLTSLSFTACMDNESDGRTITDTKDYVLTIASHKVLGVVSPSGGNVLYQVYAAKKDGSNEWVQQSGIGGFEYEEGYEYKIKIRETSYLDYSMGDPAWTEYKMTELISKEKKTSENIPVHFIPEWYEPKNSIRIQYLIEADNKELIEADLKSETVLPWNCKMDFIGGIPNRYAIWDNKNKVVDCGKFIIKSEDYTSFPETYKLLPPDDGIQIKSNFVISLESDIKVQCSISYDTFFGVIVENNRAYGMCFFYQDWSDHYKEKYPEAGVKAVVVQQTIRTGAIIRH